MRNCSITKALLSFTLMFVCVSMYAGKEWKPGYIITNANDTLRGWITYCGGGGEWKSCSFRVTENSVEQEFTPAEIKSYLFDSGLRYKSMDVTVGKYKGKFFVRSLVQGVCDLDYLNVETDSVYSIYLVRNNMTGRVIRIPADHVGFSGYRQRIYTTLDPFFEHNPVMQVQMEKSGFTIKELVKLFEKYNDLICDDQKCVSYMEVANSSPRFFISARLLLQLSGVLGWQLPGSSIHSLGIKEIKANPGFEVSGSMTLLKHSDQLLLNVGLGVSPLSLYVSEKVPGKINFKGIGILNSVSLEFHWFNKRVSPSIELGMFQMGAITSEDKLCDLVQCPDKLNPWCKEDKYKKYCLGFLLSAGIDIQINPKHSVPIRFGMYQGIPVRMAEYSEIRYSQYRLGIGYTFRIK